MNNINYQNSIQELTKLLCQLSNYIFQVNSIITQMNNIISQINNPIINQINSNISPLFNNNLILNANNNFNHFMKPQNSNFLKNPLNVIFDFKATTYDYCVCNLVLNNDMSIKEMINLLNGRLDKDISNTISKGDIYFEFNNQKIDIYSEKKISELFSINMFDWTKNKNFNFKIYAYQIKLLTG